MRLQRGIPTITISENLAAVKQSIAEAAERAGRSTEDISLIAVSKTRSLSDVRAAIDAGQTDFGENTMQDALTKIPQLASSGTRWHFIGHLQSKKAKQIPGRFQWVHSIDSIKLAQRLSQAMTGFQNDAGINCLLQVNVAAEASKYGLDKAEVLPFLDELLRMKLPGIIWRGLMTIGVHGDYDQTRAAFAELRELLDRCRNEFELAHFDQLSMGMTGDYTIAIEEGSTMVRIGTAIFGPRNRK